MNVIVTNIKELFDLLKPKAGKVQNEYVGFWSKLIHLSGLAGLEEVSKYCKTFSCAL